MFHRQLQDAIPDFNATSNISSPFTTTKHFYYESTSFITTLFFDDSDDDPAELDTQHLWQKILRYEVYGWNITFLVVCTLLLSCCCCFIILYVSYHHGRLQGELRRSLSFLSPKPKSPVDVYRHGISMDFDDSYSYNIHAIPVYEDSVQIEQLHNRYQQQLKHPCYYYIILFIHYLSILIEYIVSLYYMENLPTNLHFLYIALYAFLCTNIVFSSYGFCHIFILLVQTVVFLYLCNWSILSFIIFLSIFIFQVTSQIIIGMINHDICDWKQFKRHRADRKLNKKSMRYFCENLRFAVLFGNLELLPLFLFTFDFSRFGGDFAAKLADRRWYNYYSIWYQFMLIFSIWMASIIPLYIKYMIRFGEYFNPQRHLNHFVVALYYRVYIVFNVFFKCINVYLCLVYILNIEYYAIDEQLFHFYYSLAVMCFELLLLLFVPFCLGIYTYCCCATAARCKICVCWFFVCRIQREDDVDIDI